MSMSELEHVCDCPTRDALVCKENPDCRPSYCKMRKFDSVPVLRWQTAMSGDQDNSLTTPTSGTES